MSIAMGVAMPPEGGVYFLTLLMFDQEMWADMMYN